MQSIFCTVQDAQTEKGYFISLYDDFVGQPKGLAPVSFYLTEKGLRDMRVTGEILSKLEWLKGVIEFVQMLQKH